MKKTIAIVVCVVVLLSSICVYADNVYLYYDIPNVEITNYQTAQNGFLVGDSIYNGNNHAYAAIKSTVNINPAFGFYESNNQLHLVSIGEYPYLLTYWNYYLANGSLGRANAESLDSNGLYVLDVVMSNVIPTITISDSYESIINEYLNPPPVESRGMTINLPAGNVAYIEVDNTYDQASFAVTMPTASYAIGTSPWPESNQQYFFTSTLPSVGNFNPQGTKINWLRNGKTTLAGITTQASASISGSASGSYLCVVNPAYYGGTANGPYEFLMNGTVSITVNGFVRVKIFQLESTLGLPADPTDHSQLVVNTTVTGTDYEGEVDEDTGNIIWTDNEEPVIGGGNLVTPSVSGFQSWLQGVLDSIINIFEPAHNAIQTLASAISNFAGWLYALYIWLPSPVLSVLTSAITLAIIVGVIKVFI